MTNTTAKTLEKLTAAEAMDRANELADEDSRDQDWERGSTTWHFEDGSALEISGETVSVVR